MRLAQLGDHNFGWVWQPPSIWSMDYWQGWGTWAQANPTPILLGVIILLLLIEMLIVFKRRRAEKSGVRGRLMDLFDKLPTMSDSERREYLRTLYEDGLVEYVENLKYLKVLSDEDAKKIYIDEAFRAGLKGLVPKTSLKLLKRTLQEKHANRVNAKTELGKVFKNALTKPATAS